MPARILTLRLIIFLTLLVAIIGGVSLFFAVRAEERQTLDSMIVGADQISLSITSATWQSMLADRRSAA